MLRAFGLLPQIKHDKMELSVRVDKPGKAFVLLRAFPPELVHPGSGEGEEDEGGAGTVDISQAPFVSADQVFGQDQLEGAAVHHAAYDVSAQHVSGEDPITLTVENLR